MEILKYCDFFNVKFHFYINGKASTSSKFGGSMNLLFFISCVFTFLLYSLDDIKKLNPISSKSEIPGAQIRVVNLHNSKIWIPWRMVTYEEKFVDHRGILHPIVSLIEGHWNSSFGMNLTYHPLNYKLCNETSMANKTDEYKIDVPLNELFCIEDDDIPWGGSWLGDILYYVEVNLFLCKDGIHFNASDPRCTKMTDLLKHRNTSWLFEFYFPVVQFQPTNYDVPMAVIYRSYYYRLSTYANKVERIYIQENILSDDRSLFISSSKNSSYWGVDNNLYGDTYFMPDENDPLVKSTSSRLYSLVIYMDQGYKFYTRTYKKIFPIFSDIFPILNFLYILFKRIIGGVKLTFVKRNAAELLFENYQINHSRLNFQSRKNFDNENLLEINNINYNKIMSYNVNKKNTTKFNQIGNENNHSSFFMFNNDFRKNQDNKNMSPKEYYNNTTDKRSSYIKFNNNKKEIEQNPNNSNDQNLVEFLNRKVMRRKQSLIELKRNSLIIDFSKLENKNNNYESKKRHKKELFPLYYYFLDFFFDKMVKPRNIFKINKNYFLVYQFMAKVFDISSHILLFKYFNILRTLFLNSSNEKKERFNVKININDKNSMEKIDEINNKDVKNRSYDNYNILTKSYFV